MGVVIHISTIIVSTYLPCQQIHHKPSESLVQSKFPEEPNTWTSILFPGHCLFRMVSSFSVNLALLFSLSADGNNRLYSSRISPLSLSSSLGSKYFFGIVLALSSRSPPTEYGIRLRENAIPVSYLQPVKKGVLPGGLAPVSDSERADLGDVISALFVIGDGVRRWSENLRARTYGVDGRELDW